MAKEFRAFRLKLGAVAGVGALVGALAAPAWPALAQEGAASPTVVEEITVLAPYVVKQKPVGTSTIGGRVEVISLMRHVKYSDLDLSKQADAAVLKQRVKDTAVAACKELEVRYPSDVYLPEPGSQDCVRTATDQAMTLADQVIAASIMQAR
jgi:UrcA family protein